MTAHTPGFPPPRSGTASALPSHPGFGTEGDTIGMTWAALQDAAAAVSRLAGYGPEAGDPRIADFPAAIRRTGGWRLRMAEQGMADLAATMEPGLAALLSVKARGGDALPAARALLQEFAAARATLLALAT
jgi:hypothetical protein